MSNKDIRDIAAYWGAPVGGQVTVDMRRTGGRFPGHVNANYLDGLIAFGKEGAKLQLRLIRSLTDEEVIQSAKAITQAADDAQVVVKRQETSFVVDSLLFELGYDGTVYSYCSPNIPTKEAAMMIAYLQSIGVYVPGTIDEKYVELIK